MKVKDLRTFWSEVASRQCQSQHERVEINEEKADGCRSSSSSPSF
jgi:hypothetical protein